MMTILKNPMKSYFTILVVINMKIICNDAGISQALGSLLTESSSSVDSVKRVLAERGITNVVVRMENGSIVVKRVLLG